MECKPRKILWTFAHGQRRYGCAWGPPTSAELVSRSSSVTGILKFQESSASSNTYSFYSFGKSLNCSILAVSQKNTTQSSCSRATGTKQPIFTKSSENELSYIALHIRFPQGLQTTLTLWYMEFLYPHLIHIRQEWEDVLLLGNSE